MTNEQRPEADPNQPIDPAAEGLNPHEQLTADLVAAAEGMDGLAVPSVDQFDQARALAQELKPTGQGFYANGKRVNQAAAEAVELAGDPNRWEMDTDQEVQWRAVADAKHVSDLPEDMRAYVGKVDVYEPGSSILGRAHQEASARLALHDHIKAEEAARQAQAAEAAAEKRTADMDKERQRVYEEEHARAMSDSARDIEAKLDKIMDERVDLSSPEARRFAASTREKFRAGLERDALIEAQARANAAADAREEYVNERGGIEELDKINFKDKMGSGSGKDKAGEKSSDVRVVDNRSEEAKARVWSKDLNVPFGEWTNATGEERDAMIARAEVAKAQAEAVANNTDDAEADDDDASEAEANQADDAEENSDDDDAEANNTDDAETDDEDEDVDDAEETDGAAPEEGGRRFQFDAARARQIIAEAVARWRRQYGPRATTEGDNGDDEGQLGPDGTLILPAVEDPSPRGLRARLGRLVERARAYYGDEEHGRNRKAREIVIGAGALVGAGVGIFLASRGMSGAEAMFGGPIPPFGSGKSGGSGGETARHAHQQYMEMREGSNPWVVAKDYLTSHGNKHPSNEQIEAEDGRIGRLYMAAHHLGQYSWNAWTKIADKLPAGRLRTK